MDTVTKEAIAAILLSCVERTLIRIKKDQSHRPFHVALLTKQLILGATFERSFSTSFGQGPIEEISQILALARGCECERQKEIQVNLNKGANDEIDRILTALRDGESRPNWNRELAKIAAHQKGDFITKRVITDLWIKEGSTESFISIKTVKPNMDQTEIAKRNLLTLKAHNENYETYFGLYYNPGGALREDYNWTIPMKIFDMKKDSCVLIGQDYWDFVGGKGTYTELLSIFDEVGQLTRKSLDDIS